MEEVVKYALDNGMYAILNSHHDEWVTLTDSTQTTVTDKITKIWAQIADRFKNYGDRQRDTLKRRQQCAQAYHNSNLWRIFIGRRAERIWV